MTEGFTGQSFGVLLDSGIAFEASFPQLLHALLNIRSFTCFRLYRELVASGLVAHGVQTCVGTMRRPPRMLQVVVKVGPQEAEVGRGHAVKRSASVLPHCSLETRMSVRGISDLVHNCSHTRTKKQASFATVLMFRAWIITDGVAHATTY